MRLRCWAKNAATGALCVDRQGHKLGHIDETAAPQWYDSACGRNADSSGRETAALRILEVSHELDRRAFCDGTSDEFADRLRAVAARLYANGDAARTDHRTLTAEIDGAHAELVRVTVGPQIRREIEDIIALMVLAADLLRPFAEGT